MTGGNRLTLRKARDAEYLTFDSEPCRVRDWCLGLPRPVVHENSLSNTKIRVSRRGMMLTFVCAVLALMMPHLGYLGPGAGSTLFLSTYCKEL